MVTRKKGGKTSTTVSKQQREGECVCVWREGRKKSRPEKKHKHKTDVTKREKIMYSLEACRTFLRGLEPSTKKKMERERGWKEGKATRDDKKKGGVGRKTRKK